MPRITDRKRDEWMSRLDRLKDRANRIYLEVEGCEPSGSVEHLQNLVCEIAEAMAEIEALE